MIKIIAKQTVKPDCIEKFQSLAKELVEKSNLEEGCIKYNLVQSISDPRIHTFVEDWKDQEAIDIHNNSEHFTRIIPQFKELMECADEASLSNIVF